MAVLLSLSIFSNMIATVRCLLVGRLVSPWIGRGGPTSWACIDPVTVIPSLSSHQQGRRAEREPRTVEDRGVLGYSKPPKFLFVSSPEPSQFALLCRSRRRLCIFSLNCGRTRTEDRTTCATNGTYGSIVRRPMPWHVHGIEGAAEPAWGERLEGGLAPFKIPGERETR